MVLKGFSQINPLISSFFCCLFSPSSHFSSAPIKPPDPQPNGPRDLGQGPHPPLYTHARNSDRLYTTLRENHGNPQTLLPNGLHDSATHQHNGRTHTNGLLHNSIHNTNSYPHNGIDNAAFTHAEAQTANTLPNTQQQNPNIFIQAGTAQGGTQPPAVHLSLNAPPQTAQQNNNAQLPTIHVNLNSYPTNGQQTQQDSSLPLTSTANNASQIQHAAQSDHRMQNGQSYHGDPWHNDHMEAAQHDRARLIPTGYTHHNSNNTSQRNANTQTYQREPERHSRSDRNSSRHDATASASRQQLPWDRLRGTPAYPSGTLQRGQTSPEYTSDSTDYTNHRPVREERTTNRSQPRSQSRTTSRSRAPSRQDVPSLDRQTRSRSADLRVPNTSSVAQFMASYHKERSPHTQRKSAQQDIRDSPGSQNAPRLEATHSSNPQARPVMSQQASVGRSVVSQGPTTQQGPTALQGADTRALADPNHLPQAHMAQQHRAAPVQKTPQGLGTQTQPVIQGANQPRQGGTAPVPHSSAQPHPSSLTQATLRAHTERSQTFQNRKQQTQAALLHPGPQARAPVAQAALLHPGPQARAPAAAGAPHPPVPPPVIPLAEFQTLPKKSTQHKSPTRGPQPPRPPANIPVAQRHQIRHPNVHQHPATMPANRHHHPGNVHVHASGHRHAHAHTHGHGHPAHFTQPRQVSETQHDFSLKLQPTDAVCL